MKFKNLKSGDKFEVPFNNYWLVKVSDKFVFSNGLTETHVRDAFCTHVIKKTVIGHEAVIRKYFVGFNCEKPPAIFEINVDPNFEVEKLNPTFSREVIDCILKYVPIEIIDLV